MPNPGEPFREPQSTPRRKIDAGETRDKVNALDPAAAPLGTDTEAGAPEGPAKKSKRREAEIIPLAERRERKIGTDPNRTQAGGMEHGGWRAWAIAGALLVLILAVLAWGWMG